MEDAQDAMESAERQVGEATAAKAEAADALRILTEEGGDLEYSDRLPKQRRQDRT